MPIYINKKNKNYKISNIRYFSLTKLLLTDFDLVKSKSPLDNEKLEIATDQSKVSLDSETLQRMLEGVNQLKEIASENRMRDHAIRVLEGSGKEKIDAILSGKGFQTMDIIYDRWKNKGLFKKSPDQISNIQDEINNTLTPESIDNLGLEIDKELSIGKYQQMGRWLDENSDVISKTFDYIKNNTNIFVELGSISGAYVLGKTITKFNESVFPQSDFDKLDKNSPRWKELKILQIKSNRVLILSGLALLFLGRYSLKSNVFSGSLKVESNISIEESKISNSDITKSSIFLIFKKIKNYLPNWSIKIIIMFGIFLFLICFKLLTGLSLSELLDIPSLKLGIICISLFLTFATFFYYAICLYLFYKFNNRKVILPKIIHIFFPKWVEEINGVVLSNDIEKHLFINIYIQCLKIHGVIFILSVIFSLLILYSL